MAKFWSVLYCSHALRSISVPVELDERTRKTLFMYLGRRSQEDTCLNELIIWLIRSYALLALRVVRYLTYCSYKKYPAISAKQGSDLGESVSTSTMRLNLVGAFGDPERDSVITHLR